MVRPINILLSLFVLSWLASCDVEQEPRTEFTTPFKRHKIDLSYRLGDAFSVLRGKDTVLYNIHYNRKTRVNYILKGDKDTIFNGIVVKHRGMYLLNRPLPNGRYRISALKFTDSTVVGLGTEYLQTLIIDNEVANGNLTEMIVDTSRKYILEIDRKIATELFSTLLHNFEEEKLLIDRDYYKHVDLINSAGQVLNMPSEEKAGRALRVYPNPVELILTIVKSSEQDYNYRIIDLAGKEVHSGVLTEDKTEVDFTHLSSGEYILTASETRESVKIIKK
ncbi:MAG TPA: T9SS type A sorting domain-containing protein [Flavobacteriales bacterium]|nr:T9SS type A sorting domain-containing protein [Flavobacteriales bacterium]